jgi:hypothetical protein
VSINLLRFCGVSFFFSPSDSESDIIFLFLLPISSDSCDALRDFSGLKLLDFSGVFGLLSGD